MYCSTHSLDFFNLQKRKRKKKCNTLKVLYYYFFFIRIIYIKSLRASSLALCACDKVFLGLVFLFYSKKKVHVFIFYI